MSFLFSSGRCGGRICATLIMFCTAKPQQLALELSQDKLAVFAVTSISRDTHVE